MVTEDQLVGWTGPSSDTEQEKQERTERMVRDAIAAHDAFSGFSFDVYTKGSYANKTNVKLDSDVDVVVECREATYWKEFDPSQGGHPAGAPYEGEWSPEKLRSEVKAALQAKFPGAVTAGSTAFQVSSSSARVDADVVPCFIYRLYFSDGSYREGTRIFKSGGGTVENYPKLQFKNGDAKDDRTRGDYKKAVRILKRLENVLVGAGHSSELPSYLLECLVYNCPDEYFKRSTWRAVMQACLAEIFNATIGAEPTETSGRWLEVNEGKFLFSSGQKWTRAETHTFASAAWDFMGFES